MTASSAYQHGGRRRQTTSAAGAGDFLRSATQGQSDAQTYLRWYRGPMAFKKRAIPIYNSRKKRNPRERGSHRGDRVSTRSFQIGISPGASSGLAPPMSSSPRRGGDPGPSSGVETNRSHVIEILAGGMKEELQSQLEKNEVQEKMICKIPETTRRLDKDAYAPQFVSFGPYHRDKALSSADKYKWLCLEQILNMNKEVTLQKYLEEMDGMKQDVKDCYEEDTQKETNSGIKMLLLDGCCILAFLGILPLPQQQIEDQVQRQDEVEAEASTLEKSLSGVNIMREEVIGQEPDKVVAEASRLEKGKNIMREDVVAEASRLEKSRSLGSKEELLQVLAGLASQLESESTADSAIITHWHLDVLFVMENQLPFFVLQKIYDLATGRTATAGTAVAGTPTLEDKVDRAIKKLLPCFPLVTAKQSSYHLLHFCYLKFKPAKANSSSSGSKPTANSSSSNRKPTDERERWRGAVDLYKAGIKFNRKKCNDSESLLDVEFSKRKLMIPTLIMQNSTSSVFRNLIAFEEYCSRENYFAAYAFFMGELMRTPGDVTFLVKKGIVENYIGSDKDVSDFFNNLVKGVVFDVNGEHFLSSTFKELKSSYNSVGNQRVADLKQNHFSSPWLGISVVAATIVVVCTVAQVVFSVIRLIQ